MEEIDIKINKSKVDRELKSYPRGTIFPSIYGGFWHRVYGGFKWCNGATFPGPGGDWCGEVILPSGWCFINGDKCKPYVIMGIHGDKLMICHGDVIIHTHVSTVEPYDKEACNVLEGIENRLHNPHTIETLAFCSICDKPYVLGFHIQNRTYLNTFLDMCHNCSDEVLHQG
jgi:hypothetical protein